MQRTVNQLAIVLDTKVVREADVCLTLLGEQTGKIMAIARSARKSKKRFFGGVDLFDCATFELTPQPRSSQWYTVASVSDRHQWNALQRQPLVLTLGALCLEVTRELAAEGDPEAGNFLKPLFKTLRALEKNEVLEIRLAFAAYYLLLVFRLSGFDVAGDERELDSGHGTSGLHSRAQAWLKAMQDQGQPIVPHERELLSSGMRQLLDHAQATLEKGLRTSSEVLKIVSQM